MIKFEKIAEKVADVANNRKTWLILPEHFPELKELNKEIIHMHNADQVKGAGKLAKVFLALNQKKEKTK